MDDHRDPARELLELELERALTDSEPEPMLQDGQPEVDDDDVASRIAAEAGLLSQLRPSENDGT